MKKRKIQIAIDSPAASGAGTQAKLIAKHYKLLYLDTGKLYRVLGKFYLDKTNKIDYKKFKNKIKTTSIIDLKSKRLLKTEIGMIASKLAKDPKIRKFVSDYQKKIAQNPPKKYKGVCFDGRDITYKIMPKADVKFFLKAKPSVRAKRRFIELKKLKHNINYQDVLKNLLLRDKSDFSRKHSPLKIVKDAIVVDNSNLTIKSCFNILKKKIDDVIL